jgi:hypothetical protein
MPVVGRTFTEAGACRNVPKTSEALSAAEQAQMDADKDFLELVFEGDVRNVKKRLDAGQNPNVGNENGESAVHLAIKGATRRAAAAAAVSGELELLTTLVERGAFVE